MDEQPTQQKVKIERPLYEQEQLHKDFKYEKHKSSLINNIVSSYKTCSAQKCAASTIPAFDWLLHYRWKRDFVSDLISGITVAIMHIPQGMAYGLLGNVPPVVGIYMAFFPVLVYFFLGTSKHNSMGTFAVVCLMTGKAVLEHSHPSNLMSNVNGNQSEPEVFPIYDDKNYTPIQVATAVTFAVAMFQLAMYAFRLGIVSALLSETLISGFTTGAAVQVLASQIKDLLGINIPRHKEYFVVVNTFNSIFGELHNLNYASTIISGVTIVILSLNNELLKPMVAKKSSFPVPIELIAIIAGSLVSKYLNLQTEYSIAIVGEIPSGLPEPQVPPFALLKSVALDGLTIAIVSYTITLSMALTFAQKLNYEVDANQELLAQGAGNVVGFFFSCMPFTASLSRSLIQQTVGGKTQIASLVSCVILFFILMWIGPFFEPLPKAILASVIVVSLKGMLMQVKAFWKFWKLSKMDAAVWLVTFLTVVFISIDIGLLVGILMSLATIFLLGFKPYTCLLGSVPHTDLYLDINRYKGTEQLPGIKIFHYCGGVNFASRNFFKSELYRLIGFEPHKEFILRKKMAKIANIAEIINEQGDSYQNKTKKYERLQRKLNADLRCLIIDFSALSYIDPSGISTLKIISEDFQRIDVPIYIAGCSAPIYEMMAKCDLVNGKKNSLRVFPTIHDAVQCATDIFNQSLSPLAIQTISHL